MHIQKWYLFYSQNNAIVQQPVRLIPKQPVSQFEKPQKGQQAVSLIVQQPVAQITRIPWGHNITILYKCKTTEEALFYVRSTIEHGWSRSVLVHQIESGLYRREGKAVSNFATTLPKPQSDLAEQTLKDPYVFDFLGLAGEYKERELRAPEPEQLRRSALAAAKNVKCRSEESPHHYFRLNFGPGYTGPFIQSLKHCIADLIREMSSQAWPRSAAPHRSLPLGSGFAGSGTVPCAVVLLPR